MTTPAKSIAQSVLLVDDDEVFRTRLAKALDARGFDVRQAAHTAAATSEAQRETPELAVVDLRLPDGSGLDLVRELKRLDPSTVIVVLTGYGSIATALEAVRRGAVNYVTKPADVEQILAAFSPPGDRAPEAAASTPSLARVEWEHINRVLTDCEGNISEAARILGVHRRSLQRKLQKYPAPR